MRSATALSYSRARSASWRGGRGGVRRGPGISVKLSALLSALRVPPLASAALAALVPIVTDLAMHGARCRHPLHARCRGGRAARIVDGHHRSRWRRTMRCSPMAGRGSGSPSRLTRSAACRCVDWVGELARRHGAPADGAAGQGRLLGQRDQARPGGRVSRITRCSRASWALMSAILPAPRYCLRQGEVDLPRLRHAQRLYDRRDQGAGGTERAISSSSGCTAWGRRSMPSSPSRSGRRAQALDAGAHLRARRRPPRPARLPGAAAARERREFSSFVNRMADADVPVAALTGDPVAELAALRP